jgi:methionyl-tRNA synthetase
LQIATALSVLSEPFLPFTSAKLKGFLNVSSDLKWNDVSTQDALLEKGRKTNKSSLLFSKVEDTQIQAQLDKLAASKLANEIATKEVTPQKDTCTFEDFTKLDMRVGTIIEAEKMPKTKKLLVLKVDTGIDVRTIVSGIAESFTPEEIIGKKVTVLINLAPRALRGVDSEGMILMTETPDGTLVFVNPDTSASVHNQMDVANGSTIN